jgi:signal transduction histidine kinase
MCSAALSKACDVTVFDSGATMLEALSLGNRPQLLIIDWHMPDMSGAEVCGFVRRSFNSAALPMLILTGSDSEDSLLEALAAGANDFVRKPFVAAELQARVAAQVRAAADHERLAITEKQLRIEADFRERFMGMLAHDLRQPLNAIFMAATALSTKLDANQSAASVIQLRAAGRMKRMIAELLDFTRIRPETGMPIQRQRMSLAGAALSVVEELRASHPHRIIRFSAIGECEGDWDPDRLAQVCSNLICNALEHSDRGSEVDVSVESTGFDTVRLVIGNGGKTLPEDTLGQLFLPFRRGADRAGGGVGLGLYIVHQIVTGHGGSVIAKSENNRTELVVELPEPVIARADTSSG